MQGKTKGLEKPPLLYVRHPKNIRNRDEGLKRTHHPQAGRLIFQNEQPHGAARFILASFPAYQAVTIYFSNFISGYSR
jgi:hypothetical protein